MAIGIVALVNIFDSELVVISGGVVELGDVLLAPIREFFEGHLEGVRYRPAVPIVRVRVRRRCRPGGRRGRSHRRRVVTKLGITLPSFRDRAEPALEVAAAAEAAGLDGVFAYDHLFRIAADGTRRPALELFALLGAVAAETQRIALGSLVARATLRPPATLAHGFDTVARIAGPDRVLATIGAGDGQSKDENESFGLDFGDRGRPGRRAAGRGRDVP